MSNASEVLRAYEFVINKSRAEITDDEKMQDIDVLIGKLARRFFLLGYNCKENESKRVLRNGQVLYGVYDITDKDRCVLIGTVEEVLKYLGKYKRQTIWSASCKHQILGKKYEIIKVVE